MTGYGGGGPRNTRRGGGTRDWRALLAQTLDKHRLKRGVERARSVLVWPGVVGPELARLTRARGQQGRTLVIEARDSTLANFLTMQRPVFLQRLRAALGDDSVDELRFVVGTITEPKVAPPPDPLPPPDAARAAELAKDVPAELHPAALRAAEAITRARRWREQQGYRPCPVCGEPSAEQPCFGCRVSLDNPLVRRAAQTLARDPERLASLPDLLSDSGTGAARHLALETLAEQLDALAVECARSGGDTHYREFLAGQADVYLALKLRKPRTELGRRDWVELPERVRQVLSAE